LIELQSKSEIEPWRVWSLGGCWRICFTCIFIVLMTNSCVVVKFLLQLLLLLRNVVSFFPSWLWMGRERKK